MPLVERKDPAAFEIVYDRHGGAAYSLAYRIVGDRGTAEDVTQEAFLSVWRSGARFDRTRGSVRTWLLGVVRNRAIDVLRRDAGRAPAVSLELDTVPEQESQLRAHGRGGASPRGRRARCAACCSDLPEDQLKVVQLAYFGGLSTFRDRRGAGHAARHGQGPHATGDGEDAGAARGGRVNEHTTTLATRTTSPPTCWTRCRATRRARFERHLNGCARCQERARLAAGLGRACCPPRWSSSSRRRRCASG